MYANTPFFIILLQEITKTDKNGGYRMATQVLFFADVESMKMLVLKTKEDRLNYIESIFDFNLKNSLIKQYNLLFGSHEDDHIRNYFSFLQDFTIDQALALYDRLSNKLRLELVHAIGFDHNHLQEVIEVHEFFMNSEYGE